MRVFTAEEQKILRSLLARLHAHLEETTASR
jgi:hypothetical protein